MEVKRDNNNGAKRTTNITRDETGNTSGKDISRGESGTVSGAESEPFSSSPERFVFSDTPDEEDATVECINNSGHLFKEFKKSPPTLEEALEAMGYVKKEDKEDKEDKKPTETDEKLSRTLSEMLLKRAKEKLEEFDAPGLTAEDIAVIFCYTYEWDEEKFGKDIDSPYRKLSNSLSIDRSNANLKKTCRFLFLLLAALRKLLATLL